MCERRSKKKASADHRRAPHSRGNTSRLRGDAERSAAARECHRNPAALAHADPASPHTSPAPSFCSCHLGRTVERERSRLCVPSVETMRLRLRRFCHSSTTPDHLRRARSHYGHAAACCHWLERSLPVRSSFACAACSPSTAEPPIQATPQPRTAESEVSQRQRCGHPPLPPQRRSLH